MQELGASILHTAKNSRIYTFTWFFHIYNSSSLDSTKLGLCGGGCLVTKSCLTLATPWTAAHQAPLSMGLSRQEYWRGLPCPLPGDHPNPGIKPRSATLQADSLPSEPPGKPILAPLRPPLHACRCLARLAPGPVNRLQALTEGTAAWNIPQPWGPAIF